MTYNNIKQIKLKLEKLKTLKNHLKKLVKKLNMKINHHLIMKSNKYKCLNLIKIDQV